MPTTGADAFSVDWRLPLGEAKKRLGGRPVQGNLDPTCLLSTPDAVRAETRRMLASVAGLSDESGRVLGLFAPATPSLGDDLGRQLTACLRRLPERSKGSPKSSSSEATLVGASRTSAS